MTELCSLTTDVAGLTAALRRSRLCDGLTTEELEQVAGKVRPVRCPAGEAICRAGQAGDSMFIVADGRMKVTLPGRSGVDCVLGYLSRGDHFGEVALLDAGQRTANVTAEIDSELLLLERECFQQLSDELPKVAQNVLRTLGLRLSDPLLGQRRGLRARVVGLVQACHRAANVPPLLVSALVQRGERVVVCSRRQSAALPRARTVEPPAGENGCCLRPADWKRHADRLMEDADRVFIDIDLPMDRQPLAAVLDACDENLWLVDTAEEAAARPAWIELRQQAPSVAARSRVVWLLQSTEQVVPRWHSAWNGENRDFKFPLSKGPGELSRLQRQGLDRLARHLRGLRLGLALSGGGARGMAHLGVERALDRAGINFDFISGTSCGAMVAIGHASGYEPEYGVEQFGSTLTPPRWMRLLPGGDRWYLPVMFRLGAWDRMLRPYFHDWTLEQLLLPCSTVAVDLVTGRQVVRDRGDAIHALLESINLPVISRPICRDGMALVDGSVLNNLPADVLAGQGADFIVGVNVTATLPQRFAGNRPGMATAQMKPGGAVETLMRMFELHDYEINAIRGRAVDLLIEPDTAGFSMSDFTKTKQLAEIGEAAAEAAIPRLKAMLAEWEQTNQRAVLARPSARGEVPA